MLYLGIDQHKRQLTVNLRGEDGSVILKTSCGWFLSLRGKPLSAGSIQEFATAGKRVLGTRSFSPAVAIS